MKDTVLLFESRDLCYESNRYFTKCLKQAFESLGYPVEVCDLSLRMEEKLETVLAGQEKYMAALDFNSLLPRMELEDGTPYLEAFHVPFYNYLVDHPLYHHVGIRCGFSHYSVICIDTCHQKYMQKYYPQIRQVYYLPLGAAEAEFEKELEQKRFELLFLGTYEPEAALHEQLEDYALPLKKEVSALIDMMDADHTLTQEDALAAYLRNQGEVLTEAEFAVRLNHAYLADKYLRNLKRKKAVIAAEKSKIPFTVIGHGWDVLDELHHKQVTLYTGGVSYPVSIQMMADAKILLNTTPCFHGGLHDRVYTAMLNHTLAFTEDTPFSRNELADQKEAVLYNDSDLDTLTEKLADIYKHPAEIKSITDHAYRKAQAAYTWEHRAETFFSGIHTDR